MKKTSSFLFVALLVGASAVLMQCGTAPAKCDATSCASGCCDKDTCVAGTGTNACGKGGAVCGVCTAGQVCRMQACGSSSVGGGAGGSGGGSAGGAGGGTGGGVAGGAGGGTAGGAGGGTAGGAGGAGGSGGAGGGTTTNDAGCQVIAFLPQVNVIEALYSDGLDGGDVIHSGITTDATINSTHNEYYFQIYYFNNATQGAHTLLPTSEADCEYCLYLDTDCDMNSSCSNSFLAQGGAINITAGTKNPTTGRLTATATNLRFVEWDYDNDIPLDGGQCLDVAQANLDVRWTATGIFQGDGGAP